MADYDYVSAGATLVTGILALIAARWTVRVTREAASEQIAASRQAIQQQIEAARQDVQKQLDNAKELSKKQHERHRDAVWATFLASVQVLRTNAVEAKKALAHAEMKSLDERITREIRFPAPGFDPLTIDAGLLHVDTARRVVFLASLVGELRKFQVNDSVEEANNTLENIVRTCESLEKNWSELRET